MRCPNNIKIRLRSPVYFERGVFETEQQYKERQIAMQNIVNINPHTLELSQAKKLHEWLGRFIEWKERIEE